MFWENSNLNLQHLACSIAPRCWSRHLRLGQLLECPGVGQNDLRKGALHCGVLAESTVPQAGLSCHAGQWRGALHRCPPLGSAHAEHGCRRHRRHRPLRVSQGSLAQRPLLQRRVRGRTAARQTIFRVHDARCYPSISDSFTTQVLSQLLRYSMACERTIETLSRHTKLFVTSARLKFRRQDPHPLHPRRSHN